VSVVRHEGRCRRGVPIPWYSMENSLQKLFYKFERDPTVASKVMELLSRYSGRVGGMARLEVVGME